MNITHVNLSIPLNTNVVGGIIMQTPLRLKIDLPFQDFFSRVCANMDLDPLQAQIGYKFSGDRKMDPPFRLATEDELRAAMAQSAEKMRRARTSAWKSGPVQFFGPKFRDRDQDRSAFILELKKTRPDRKKTEDRSLRPVIDQSLICNGLNWSKTGFSANILKL